jgi:hypothetical protein
MIEARVFLDSLDNARKVLGEQKAELKGKYKIHDTIYRNKDKNISLTDEFLRLRVIPENIWNEKEVILALKQTNLHTVGKDSRIPLKLQFDTREQAQAYYEGNLKNTYVLDFDFWRIGWQYFLANGDAIDLEIVEEKYPSIELKSETDEGMEKLLALFHIEKESVISGPSVVAVRNLLLIKN